MYGRPMTLKSFELLHEAVAVAWSTRAVLLDQSVPDQPLSSRGAHESLPLVCPATLSRRLLFNAMLLLGPQFAATVRIPLLQGSQEFTAAASAVGGGAATASEAAYHEMCGRCLGGPLAAAAGEEAALPCLAACAWIGGCIASTTLREAAESSTTRLRQGAPQPIYSLSFPFLVVSAIVIVVVVAFLQ